MHAMGWPGLRGSDSRLSTLGGGSDWPDLPNWGRFRPTCAGVLPMCFGTLNERGRRWVLR